MASPSVEKFQRECARLGESLEGVEGLREIQRVYAPGLAKLRREHNLTPVPVGGSRARGLKAGFFKTRLRDGSWGYFQRSTDDCYRAALASLAQVPMPLVPDLAIDAQRILGTDPELIELGIAQKLTRWEVQYGLRIALHASPPSTGRWIAVLEEAGLFSDHCVLMLDRTPIFDPSQAVPPPRGDEVVNYGDLAHIAYGITIERN